MFVLVLCLESPVCVCVCVCVSECSVFCVCLQLWEAVSGKCVATLVGYKEEVLDVCFDLSGQLIAAASADGEINHSLKAYVTSKVIQL